MGPESLPDVLGKGRTHRRREGGHHGPPRPPPSQEEVLPKAGLPTTRPALTEL